MNTTKQSYTAPAVRELGTVSDLTLASLNQQIADKNIQAGQQNTSS